MSDIRKARRAVIAMFILNGALFGIWASRIPAIAETHGLGPGQLGLLLLLLAVGAIIAFPLAGRGADRYGANLITWRVAIAYTITLFLIALAPGTPWLAAALFLFGAAHGAMDVAMNAWAGEVERRAGRPLMSSFHAMFSLGAGLGAGSGYLAVTAGFSVPVHFISVGAVLAVIALPLAKIQWQSDLRPAGEAAPVFSLPKGGLLAVGFVAFCAALGEGAMADWSGIFLMFATGVTEAHAALGYAVFSVAMVVMRLLGDRVIQRLGPVVAAGLAGITASAGATIAVVLASFPAALTGFALMGLGYAVIMPLAFTGAANDPHVPPGAAIAGVSTLGYGGFLTGPPLIGFIAEATSIRLAFAVLAAFALLIALMAGALRPIQRSDGAVRADRVECT